MLSVTKFLGGLLLGAAIGAGTYVLFTNDDDDGVIHGVKAIINDAVVQGKQAAEERRVELQNELRQPLTPPTSPNSGT